MPTTTTPIKKDINFCIFQDRVIRKIFKIFFQKKSPDFYVALPYFAAKEYQIGTLTIPQGVTTLPTFDLSKNKKAGTTLPVKFSYHLDGNVHFKPTSYLKAMVTPAFKYDHLLGTPMAALSGEHIFTITFEGLDNFLAFDPAKDDKNTHHLVANIPADAVNFKVTGYAGFSEAAVKGKYSDLEPAIITISRPQLPGPLYIGIYLLIWNKTIQQGTPSPFLTTLVGFQRTGTDIAHDLSTLYLHAN